MWRVIHLLHLYQLPSWPCLPPCVAPCSILPSLGLRVGRRSHRSRPGHSAVAEARSGGDLEGAGPDRQLALHSQRRRFSVHAKQTGEAARSPTSLSGPTGTAAAIARTSATTRTRTLGQQDAAGVPGGKPNPLQDANSAHAWYGERLA